MVISRMVAEFREQNKKDQEFLLKMPVWNGRDSLTSDMLKVDADGIPALRLEDWGDYRKLLSTLFFQKRRDTLIFRGQRKHFDSWSLEPVLWRGRKENVKLSGLSEEKYRKKIADRQIEQFRKRMRHRAGYNIQGMGDDDLWAIGQHQFLQTPLLDWTHSPSVALYFAFWSENLPDERNPFNKKYSPFRAIYVLDNRLCEKSTTQEQDIKVKDSTDTILLVSPKEDLHGRLISQDGLFTFGPYRGNLAERLVNLAEKQAENASGKGGMEEKKSWSYFFKILIPNRDRARQECLQELMWMNVHPGSLFPDIYGATQCCNIELDLSDGKENSQGRRILWRKENKCRQTYLAEHLPRLADLKRKERKDLPPRVYIADCNGNDKKFGLEMVLIEAGDFTMGENSGSNSNCDNGRNAKPAHKVLISHDFYLGKYPVTQRQWDEVMKEKDQVWGKEAKPNSFDGFPDNPVVRVSWEDTEKFIKELNEKLKGDLPSTWQFRLPTEAEWEYACRAGSQTIWPWDGDETELEKYAWYEKNSGGGIHRIGMKAPNNWGLYDMLGNIWEWCADWYGSDYYEKCAKRACEGCMKIDKKGCANGLAVDPLGPSKGDNRVTRGGGWGSAAKWACPTNHGKARHDKREINLGFRLACGRPLNTINHQSITNLHYRCQR